MDRKKILKIILGIMLAYFVLMCLLYVAECVSGTADSPIKDFGDVVWYLLATLTTVGYGDVTPATTFGKVIGAVMMISSAGVLTFLLGLMISLLFGRLVPAFTLWKNRKRIWYVFSEDNESTRFLARQLAAEEKDALVVFCTDPDNFRHESEGMRNITAIDEDAETVLNMQNSKPFCHVFFMTSNGWDNYGDACEFLKKTKRENIKVYCETEYQPEHMPDRIVLFNRPDNTARSYWLDNPIEKGEKTILFIGSGELATRLLERGLLINVLPDDHPLEYHIFGDWTEFRSEHYELDNTVSVDKPSDSSDSVIFEQGAWNYSPELLLSANRIIICGDSEEENLACMNDIFKYYPVKAKVDICASFAGENCRIIGDRERVMGREMVMQDRLNQTAVTLNDLYRQKTGQGCPFNELATFYRQSNISSADHMLTKIRLLLPEENATKITPELCAKAAGVYADLTPEQREKCRFLEHKRWVRFYVMNNWAYDPVRNNPKRKHPMIVPYDDLTVEEQILDDSAWEVMSEVAKAWL